MQHGFLCRPCFTNVGSQGHRSLRYRSSLKSISNHKDHWQLKLSLAPFHNRPVSRQQSESKLFGPWLLKHLNRRATEAQDQDYASYLKQVRSAFEKSASANASFDIDLQPKSSPDDPLEDTIGENHNVTIKLLEKSHQAGGANAVDLQLQYCYFNKVATKKFPPSTLATQQELADLRYPEEWYPATRYLQRTIHLHVGPTNSGKTYHALRRLETSRSGIYAGPLRMLAHEVYSRLNAKGIPCDLITGDERIETSHTQVLQSCTVEMIPLNTMVDVAVVDEIQMIGDDYRGWAWTQALLGLQAKEIHLCGEERAVPLIRELASLMGDELQIHTYKRLSPLRVMSTSLKGSVANLRKGDCIVVFSRLGIHAMKREIEKVTKKRVAIVYGGLPPEIRAQQARLFNDPNNDYDILVASDAIGMGLNLAIKRIVFESTHKRVNREPIILSTPEIKQIAGRAGRFRTADSVEAKDVTKLARAQGVQNLGLVTTFEDGDLPILKKAMRSDAHPIMSAGIFPPTNVLTSFAAYFPRNINFSFIMQRLHEITRLNGRYKLCKLRDQIGIADAIQPVQSLTVKQKIILCAAPCPVQNPQLRTLVTTLARCIGDRRSGALLDIPNFDLEVLDEKISTERIYLERLENLHKGLILYLWLSYRFMNVFVSQKMGFYVKGLVEERIDKTLSEFSASRHIQRKIKAMKKGAMKRLTAFGDVVADTQERDVEALDIEEENAPGPEWLNESEMSNEESHENGRFGSSHSHESVLLHNPVSPHMKSHVPPQPADLSDTKQVFSDESKILMEDEDGHIQQSHAPSLRDLDQISGSDASHDLVLDSSAQDFISTSILDSQMSRNDTSTLKLKRLTLETLRLKHYNREDVSYKDDKARIS